MTGGFNQMILIILVFLIVGSSPIHAQGILTNGVMTHPRFALGDFDGDGESEILVGGRIGPFLSVDTPRSHRHARVDLFRVENSILQSLAASSELYVVEDVAAGDLDGDGRDEILVVGAGLLTVLDWRDGRLSPRFVKALNSSRTDRIDAADVDADGMAEVVVTLYDIQSDSEIGRTEIVLLKWQGGNLNMSNHFYLNGHIGDLCLADLDGQGGPELILETGWGDEGGQVIVYQTSGKVFQEKGRGQATTERRRSLSMSTTVGPAGKLAVYAAGGGVRTFTFIGDQLQFDREASAVSGLTGFLLVPSTDFSTEILFGTREMGPSRRLSPLSY